MAKEAGRQKEIQDHQALCALVTVPGEPKVFNTLQVKA